MTEPIYNQIGFNYAKYRKADPRIVKAIIAYLDMPKNSLVGDIGAGTGNYGQALAECGYQVKCIEPSDVMLDQQKMHQNMQWIKGDAENIPLESESMDAVMAILAFHHFQNSQKAIEEMTRVSKGNIVLFTFDPREVEALWIANYFPEIWAAALDIFPPLSQLKEQIKFGSGKNISSHVFKLPHDLTDYFVAAGWRKPEIYLDPVIRSCMSAFAVANQSKIEAGIEHLKQDLDSGRWESNYGYLRNQESLDVGYRFVVTN
jgi:ubiquinone/menaquinone biosynthesis C-methylase UbiE